MNLLAQPLGEVSAAIAMALTSARPRLAHESEFGA